MNTSPVTRQVTQPAPSAFDQLADAETAAWDAYEAKLAAAQEAQDALVSAGSSVLKAYNAMQWRRDDACNALDDALAVARAEYEDAQSAESAHPPHYIERAAMFLTFEAAPEVTLPANDDALVAEVVAAQAAQAAQQAHFEAAEAARLARPVYANLEEFEAAGWEAM